MPDFSPRCFSANSAAVPDVESSLRFLEAFSEGMFTIVEPEVGRTREEDVVDGIAYL